MAETLHALGEFLISSIPTILFFVFLAFFLKRVYFKPIAQVLEERRKATEGVQELAKQALAAADQKSDEFERALQIARNQIHQENDAQRRTWEQEQSARLAQARGDADGKLEQAKREIAQQVEQAKAQLELQVQALSEQIVNTLTRRRAA